MAAEIGGHAVACDVTREAEIERLERGLVTLDPAPVLDDLDAQAARRGVETEPHEQRGRLLEVRGQLNGFTDGRVGEAAYRYPVVISATLALWPDRPGSVFGGRQPRINFGIGVSNHGGGVGVGVGF